MVVYCRASPQVNFLPGNVYRSVVVLPIWDRTSHAYLRSIGKCNLSALGEGTVIAYLPRRQGAGQPRDFGHEESPGSTKQGWRVTPAGRESRESATESIPPMAPSGDQARVKGCGKSAPGLRQRGPHGKPHPEQGRIGAARSRKRAGAFRIDRPGWLLELWSNPEPRRMAASA